MNYISLLNEIFLPLDPETSGLFHIFLTLQFKKITAVINFRFYKPFLKICMNYSRRLESLVPVMEWPCPVIIGPGSKKSALIHHVITCMNQL